MAGLIKTGLMNNCYSDYAVTNAKQMIALLGARAPSLDLRAAAPARDHAAAR